MSQRAQIAFTWKSTPHRPTLIDKSNSTAWTVPVEANAKQENILCENEGQDHEAMISFDGKYQNLLKNTLHISALALTMCVTVTLKMSDIQNLGKRHGVQQAQLLQLIANIDLYKSRGAHICANSHNFRDTNDSNALP